MRTSVTVKLNFEGKLDVLNPVLSKLGHPVDVAILQQEIEATVNNYLANEHISMDGCTFSVEVEPGQPMKPRGPVMGQSPPLVKFEKGFLNVGERRFRDGRPWVDWLDQHKSFRYVSDAGSFTCSRDNRYKWYARRRIDNKLKKVYLGDATRVTLTALWEAAHKLSQLELL